MRQDSFNLKRGERFSGSIDNCGGRTIEARMSKDSLIRTEGNGCGVEIHSIEGALWITQENDPKDHFLMPGEVFVINRSGTVIVCALKYAHISIRLSSFQQALELALNKEYSQGGCWKLK